MESWSAFVSLRKLINVTFYLFCVFSPSVVLAASPAGAVNGALSEFLIALVLGISIPILFITKLLSKRNVLQWRFVFASSIFFVALLSASYLWQPLSITLIQCSFAVFSVLSVCWFLSFTRMAHLNVVEYYSFLVVSLFAYFVALFLIPNSMFWLAWLVLSAVVLVIASYHVVKHTRQTVKVIAIAQWLSIFVFLGATLLWIKQYLSINAVISTGALAYLSIAFSQVWLALSRLSDTDSHSPAKGESAAVDLDKATNLPTNQQVLHQLEQLMTLSPEKRYAVLTFKPKNFEQVNMVLGHQNSDILLLQLAYCLQKSVQDNESLHSFNNAYPACRIARLQGLHFVVVLDLSHTEHPERTMIEQLRKRLTTAAPSAMTFKSYSLNFDLVFGVAITGEHGRSASEIVAHAVDALLVAEQEQVLLSYYNNKQTLYTERQLLQMETLKTAIKEGHLHYFLQPQVLRNENTLVGFTIKAHWYANKDKPLLLENFVTIAEQSGEIFTLFRQMLNTSFEALFKLSQFNVTQPLAIPLISKALLEPDTIEYLEKTLKVNQVNPSLIVIDLNESILLAEPVKANSFINQLKSIGVNVAISQFTGSYESLRYLRRLAIKQVKVNCSGLVDNNEKNAEKVIVNALLSLCRTMNLTIVGTEVNTERTEQIFSTIGGTIMQGNSIDHGVVLDELEIWIKKWGYNMGEITPGDDIGAE